MNPSEPEWLESTLMVRLPSLSAEYVAIVAVLTVGCIIYRL